MVTTLSEVCGFVGSLLQNGGEAAKQAATALRETARSADAEVLRLWSELSPQTIFPNRRVGILAAGAEASFLVLDGDPLADFANVRRIRVRGKDGQVLR